ncbi:TonB-dependent receptor [Sphingomonas changnyeongensis]|uniref:TonB-dependent receptor n=1 Tax=Sphingomonas changnyeongensis TaxID=2698679 RepID=A0A7Z2NXU0_9SPHN|nr:TonB-dependent receptor [Sphingomonas changnyeongensis]
MQLALRRRLLASTVLIGASMLSTAAFAQDAQTAETEKDDTIVVTGSLIANPNLEASSPVTSIGSEEALFRNTNTAEQLLRQLPGVTPSIGSAVNNGNGGAAFVNLRGLGTNRNLVLLDGDRVTPANQGGAVDLNIIPVALIESTQILTGGASTTYGADAVSGVVNFITKRDFTGVELNLSNQITERGDGNYLRADLTMGASLDDGRGNVVFSIGYQEADPVYQGARGFSRFGISSTSGRAAGGSPTSVPSSFALTGLPQQQVSPDGASLVPAYQDFNFNPFNIFQTPFQRFNVFTQGNYEIADGVEVYGRALYSKNTVQTIIAPSGIFGEALSIPANNPFLTTGIRNQLCSAAGIAASACTPTSTTAIPIPAVYRRTVELGPRISTFVTQVFDYRAGVRVDVTDTIKADVSASYGQSENDQTQSGYVLRSRVQQALNANNVNTCTNTANGCTPLNLFGPAGSISPGAAAFLSGESQISFTTALAQVRGVVSGDFGVALPSANDAIGFAVGAEYRNYRASRVPDFLAQQPGELGGAGGAVLPLRGGYDVYEAFGEVIAPLVQDKPFFQDLTLEAGIRYSSYTVDAPSNPSFKATTWKAGGSWTPVEGLKLRGNYQRAVRAPNIGELFAPVVTGLTNLVTDPCASLDVSNPPIRRSTGPTGILRDVCLAQGAPLAGINNIQDPAAGQANGTGGGNPNIQPEKSDSYTIGVVLQPQAIPGLSVTVDYYNIVVNSAITAATPGDVIGACFNNLTAASVTSAACTSIRRNPVNGRLSGSTATTLGLPQPLTNLGRLSTNGIDLSVNYNTDLDFAKLSLSFNGNWTRSIKFRASPTGLNRECAGFYSTNCSPTSGSPQPEFSWNQRTTLSFDMVDVSLLWRHISAIQYEPGIGTLFNGAITGNTTVAGQRVNFNRIPAYNYFDLSVRFDLGDNLDVTLTALNMFDKQPPIVGSNAGATAYNSGNTFPSTYDALGRTFAATARVKF